MIITVASGKGGTGKTSICAALAHLGSLESRLVLADADVDAANLELVLAPTMVEAHDFRAGELAVVDAARCLACGRCAEVCRFEAVVAGETYRIEPLACEGCASCFYQCPAEAIRMVEQRAGVWYRSDTRFGPLFHAHLFAGQENSGKLVMLVRQQARLLALDVGADYLLVDGPPGIGCPVIASSSGADLALLVAEPTVSGVHDLERVLATVEHFRVPALVCINKADVNPRRADEIVAVCEERHVPVVGRIPFDTVVTEAMVCGQPVTAYADGDISREMRQLWTRVREALEKAGGR